MRICLNSRDLCETQRQQIEQYFDDHFTFNGRGPELMWKDDESDYVLLGFPQGSPGDLEINPIARDAHDAPVVMFRVHENALLRIAGRQVLQTLNLPKGRLRRG